MNAAGRLAAVRRRLRRVLLPLVLAGLAWMGAATLLERRALDAQRALPRPAVAAAGRIDPERLMQDLRALASPAFEGRRTGSPGNARARAFVIERFTDLGLEPVLPGYVQRFGFVHHSIRALFRPGRPFRTEYRDAANLLARVPGRSAPAPVLVLSAHYDHLGVRGGELYPGADDNASGVSALLAIAAYLAGHRPAHPVLLAAFDAEELGNRGSQAFVREPPVPLATIGADLNLDMVSRSERGELFAAGGFGHPALRELLEGVRARSSVRVLLGHDKPRYRAGFVEDWSESSDHGPFRDAGIPFVYLGVEDHPGYHDPSDTPEHVDPRFFAGAAETALDTLLALDARLDALAAR